MSELPEWMYPPRAEGWFAEDLDHLPQAPPRTELRHGSLVFFLRPRSAWHSRVTAALATAIDRTAPAGWTVDYGTAVILDRWNRTRPDIVVGITGHDPGRIRFTADEVVLVVEVVSPDAAHADRVVKPEKYAEAGIPHYWVIEEEDGLPVVHVYELDTNVGAYAPGGIFRGRLQRSVPFPVDIDLDALVPAPKGKKRAD
ncbi:Uma2 family endonuclease [Kitasatospora sp. NPDC093806]|uniref:Uma2 family endonuclease n=1 Tax=Kitasatospora sp. NPDC093806 TaxID=3155075 RepID=UPI00343D884B